MHNKQLNQVAREVSDQARLRYLGKIFQLSRSSLVLDLGLRNLFLLINVEPASARFYLVQRRQRELEKQSSEPSSFAQLLKARLGGTRLLDVYKDPADRILKLKFSSDELGQTQIGWIVVQLTGRTANMLLLDETETVIDSLRPARDPGQRAGDTYKPPGETELTFRPATELPAVDDSPSAHAEANFREVDERLAFESLAKRVTGRVNSELSKQKKLKANLEHDLAKHGDPAIFKRRGDLLLANIATAIRKGGTVRVTDYYAEGAPTVELEVDENLSLQDEAARNFRQYTKAKHARESAAQRINAIESKITELESRKQQIDTIVATGDLEKLEGFSNEPPRKTTQAKRPEQPERIPGVKKYVSSDNYEVWVGRAAKDNDNLTFKLAKPSDLWLHAGDYPGSHVIVRNPTRKEVPHRTIIEAAQLAARFSQASEDSKVVVHYAERKFLSKPKGAAPGLVRMSTFRSIVVEPKEAIKRLTSLSQD